jgi:hypothetical protein
MIDYTLALELSQSYVKIQYGTPPEKPIINE